MIRGAIGRMLDSDPAVRVVARVANGQQALEAVRRERFDVAVLDIEMPVMDGMTALPLLLRADPGLRVVMASTLTTRGADIALQALRLGAADYVPKPSVAAIADDSFRRELLAKVKGLARLRRRESGARRRGAAAGGRQSPPGRTRGAAAAGGRQFDRRAAGAVHPGAGPGQRGAGAGGDHPAHARHLHPDPGRASDPPGRPALRRGARRRGVAARPDPSGAAATGICWWKASRARCGRGCRTGRRKISAAPRSIPMLRSAAASCGGRVLVVMLTGMGHDGREGTRAVVEAGGAALAQDEATSVVWGMPGAIARPGCATACCRCRRWPPACLSC